jgi:hypothetical protein
MSRIFNYFCSCKSRKSQENVLDPTTLDLIKVINNKNKNRKNTHVDDLNISYHDIKSKEQKLSDFNCFSLFDACYNKNDDEIKRTDYNSEYAIAYLSQE